MNIKNERWKLFLLMGIAYALLLIGVVDSVPLHTSSDELGGIVGAAKLAGFNWDGIIENSGYYGFGWYSLFFWVFKLTDSPIIIYRVIIIITAFLRVFIIPIAYYVGKNFLKIDSQRILYACSFLMPFLSSTPIGIISNEYVLEFLIWLIILLTCKVCQKEKRLLYAVLLIAACFYSLFIHTRALTLLIALAIVFIALGIIQKSKYLSIGITGGIFFAYIVSKKIISFYQVIIYGGAGENVRNGAVQISTKFSLFDKDTWDVWFRMVVGAIGTETILTGGIFIISIVIFINYLKKVFCKEYQSVNMYCNIILSISILCMGATIFAFLFSSWFDGMLATWGVDNAGKSYTYKGLTYVRYWNIYMPPFIMCTISMLRHLDYKKIMQISAIVLSLTYLLFIINIVPLIKENENAASFLYGIVGFRYGDKVSEQFYYKCMIISILIFCLMSVLSRFKHKEVVILLAVVFMVFNQMNRVYNYDNLVKEKMADRVDASYEVKCNLDKKGIHISNIYLNDTTKGTDNNWKLYSIAQFYFNRYTVSKELPLKLGEFDIIISTSKSSEIEERYENVMCYVLDDNEIWYTEMQLSEYESVIK